ncbi:MAG: biopolymer transporter ExbD [Chromatiales bacterium]|nr:biopolymer transporter ExbD [Chromatiales bacterium]
MNLMVILVPFLLITAVFSRMTVLELNLPRAGSREQPGAGQRSRWKLVVRAQGFDIQDGWAGTDQADRARSTDNSRLGSSSATCSWKSSGVSPTSAASPCFSSARSTTRR